MIETTIIIIASMLTYANLRSLIGRRMILCVVSSFVYWQFVGSFSLLLPFVALLTWLSIRNEKHGRIALIAYVSALAICFILFKIEIVPVFLPVGFSVLCFSGISLVVDCHKNKRSASFLDIYTYLSFFPKILAGPIERIDNFMTQLDTQVTRTMVYRGFKIIVLCLFTKYVVGETIGSVMTAELYGVNQVIEIMVYAVLFYLDFWAYSFLAIGIALLFGINLTVNFNKPYRSKSFHDFWHRWNITLSAWLRDYVYIPLGGNRNGFPRYIVNVLLVFIVSAIWHDIAITFLLWGFIHAILLISERRLSLNRNHSILYAVFVVIVSGSLWQLFRYYSLSDLYHMADRIGISQDIDATILAALVIGALYVMLIEGKFVAMTIFNESKNRMAIVSEVIFVSVICILTLLGMNIQSASPFFYLAY